MKHRRLGLSVLVLAVAAAPLATAGADVGDGVDGNYRRLRRLRRVQDATTTNAEEAENTDLGLDVPQSLCRSIVAVGGWARPSRRLRKDDDGDAAHETGLASAMAPRIRPPEPHIDFMESPSNSSDVNETATVYMTYRNDSSAIGDTEEEFVCELYDGTSLPISGTDEQMVELRELLNNGTLVSAESSVEADGIERESGIDGGEGIETGGAGGEAAREVVVLPPGSIRVINNNYDDGVDISDGSEGGNDGGRRNRRRLNMYTGAKRVLAVRVIDNHGRSVPGSAAYVSDKFFGTNGDKATMTSGFAACSFSEFTVTSNYGPTFPYSVLKAPGVLEVNVDISLEDSPQETVRNRAIVAAQRKLGFNLPGPFDHVAFVVEKCYPVGNSCSFAAYAYVNHWLSLYVGENYRFPGVQMHEIGHNLNLAHSGGLDGRTYTDHTCLMGNPLWEDDVGKMCFNPVKNFQIAVAGRGWYDSRHIQVFNTGTAGGTSWRGRIVGVAEYDRNPSDRPIVVKIETGGGSDWFVGFNRAVGPNSDNQQGSDRVMVHTVKAGNGYGYSTSSLEGTLGPLQRGVISNWRGTQYELVIKVNAINTNAVPGYADIEITFGPQAIGKVRLAGNNNKCMAADPSDSNVRVADCRENDPNQTFEYVPASKEIRRGGLCVDASLHTPNVYLYSCHGGKNQQWAYDWRYQQLKPLNRDDRCLDKNLQNDNLYMYPCHGGMNQKLLIPARWSRFFPRPTTRIQLYADTSKCMTANPATKNIFMNPCNDDSPNQLFAYDPSSMKIKHNGACLHYNFDTNNVFLHGCMMEKSNQKWIFNPITLELKTRYNDKCLDMRLDGSGNLKMYPCHGKQNQKFVPSDLPPPLPSSAKHIHLSANPDKCMEANPNKNLYVSSCKESSQSQIFDYDSSTLEIKHGSLCADYNFYTNNVYLHSCHGKSHQQWLYDFQTSQLRSLRDGKCLDMKQDGSDNLRMNGCYEGASQQFTAAFVAPPTSSPTSKPSRKPTNVPTDRPTPSPTSSPTGSPTYSPSGKPSRSPSSSPTGFPTKAPSPSPTLPPSESPSSKPTIQEPMDLPTKDASDPSGSAMSMSIDFMVTPPPVERPVFGRRQQRKRSGGRRIML